MKLINSKYNLTFIVEKTLTISNLFSEMQNSIYWPRYFDFREYAFFSRRNPLYNEKQKSLCVHFRCVFSLNYDTYMLIIEHEIRGGSFECICKVTT